MSQLYYSYTDTTATVVGCDLDYEGEVVIPETVNNINVTGIAANAFRYCSSITSVIIPTTVTSIGEYAFCECTSLTSINIPTITTISVGCFKGCKSLESVDFNNVTTIEDLAFAECSSFNMVLPNTITSVGIRAFHHTGITNLSISENLSSIGDGAFCWCPLESISIDSGNTNYIIEDDVLYNTGKTELILYPPFKTDTTFTIPETVTRINKYAFEENYYMEKIRINDAMITLEGLCGLMNIKDFECYNSDEVVTQTTNGYRVLTNRVTQKNYLLYGNRLCRVPVNEVAVCSTMSTVEIEGIENAPTQGQGTVVYKDTLTSLLYWWNGEEYVQINSASTGISFSGCLSGAFAGCNLLTKLDSSYTYSIGGYGEILRYKCFYKCSNISGSITLGLSFVFGIDDYAFAECKNITDIILNIGGPLIDAFSINEYAFYNCSKINTISLKVGAQKIITKTHSFENCQQLTTLTFPRYPDSTDITSEKNAFLNTANNQSNLQCEVFNNQLIGIFGVPDSGQIITPVSDNKTIWRIWKANPNVASIVLGEGMTKLMGYTFCNTSYSKQGWSFNNLQHIKFPSTLTEIGGYAFYKTSLNMNTVDFSACNNITTVEPYAFYEVQDININLENLRYAGQFSFWKTTFVNEINININDEKGLVVYETYAFLESLGLKNINIICDSIYIGTSRSSFTNEDYSCSFNSISYYNADGVLVSYTNLSSNSSGSTFRGDNSWISDAKNNAKNNAKNINIVSNNITLSGERIFAYNPNLEVLHIKSNNSNINSQGICVSCSNLKEVTISGSVNQYDFEDCYNLQKIKFYKMQSSTAILSNYSFYNCYIINTLDFSESGLTEINMQKSGNYYYPFGYSKLFCLKNLILPDNLTSLTIAGLGFKGKNFNLPNSLKALTIDICPALSEIDIPKNVESITFVNNYDNYNHSIRKLKVPNGCTINNAYYKKNGTQIPIKITYY